MVIGFLIALTVSFIQIYEVSSLGLSANYKYWKSVSDKMSYDHSGNSRHGILNWNYTVTDRGISPSNHFYDGLMSYAFISQNEYVISCWILNAQQTSNFYFNIIHVLGNFVVNYDISAYSINIRTSSGLIRSTPISQFEGWNFHTVKIYTSSSIYSQMNIDIYLNLGHVYSTSLDIGAMVQVSSILMGLRSSSLNANFILYELYVHVDLSNISDLGYLFSSSASCGCAFNCPTSPTRRASTATVCLQAYDKTKNADGKICPSSCTSNGLSCDSTLNCIPKSKIQCKYGLYDRETSQCIFYCPGDSCKFQRVQDPTTGLNSFTSSCKEGYKQIRSNPHACISNHCIDFREVGYKYVCDVPAEGYALDNLGECCICAANYFKISSNPLVCINTPNCIAYLSSASGNICINCAAGYKLNSPGYCSECSPGYTQVSANPLVCMNILNCLEYTPSYESYICGKCEEGFKVDSNGYCNECDEDYVKVYENPLVCVLKVDNCVRYIYDGDWKCDSCDEGYFLDEERRCYQCKDEYYMVSRDPHTCIKNIDHCIDYYQENDDWVCKECEGAYIVSSLGLCDECKSEHVRIEGENIICKKEISHCIKYDLYSEESKCNICEIGYTLTNYQCNSCSDSYIPISITPLICAQEIENCIQYDYDIFETVWKCNVCASEYILHSDSKCIPKIQYCQEYDIISQDSWCIKCNEGFILACEAFCISSKNCRCKDGEYISSEATCEPCPEHCSACLYDGNNIECPECESGYTLKQGMCTVIEKYSESSYILPLGGVSAIRGVIIASVSVSMISLNINNVVSIIGTIQLLSYILLYNITIPDKPKAILEGINIIKIVPNIFEYFIPNQNTMNNERYNRVDITNELVLINSGKTITILIPLILIIIFLKLITRILKKTQEYLILKYINKILEALEWNFVIGYIIQGSLDLTISSLINTYHVNFSSNYSIGGCIVSIFILVSYIQILLLVSPIFLFLYLNKNFEKITAGKLGNKLSILYQNFQIDKIERLLLSIIEILRRLVYGVNMILLYPSPYIQVVINSSFSLAIFYYILSCKPYKNRLDSLISLYTEFITFLILSIIGVFLENNIPQDLYDISEWLLVVLLYMSILVPALINIVLLITRIVNKFKRAREIKQATARRDDQTTENIPTRVNLNN